MPFYYLPLLSRLDLDFTRFAEILRSFRARSFAFARLSPHEPEYYIPSWKFLMLFKWMLCHVCPTRALSVVFSEQTIAWQRCAR